MTQINNNREIEWTKKYYVVEGISAYSGDKYTLMKVFTAKEEAQDAKREMMNTNPSDLRNYLRTRYRHRYVLEMEAYVQLQGEYNV